MNLHNNSSKRSMTEEEAIEIAEKFKGSRKKRHQLVGAAFLPAVNWLSYASPARWVVGYQKPQPADSVIDDGDMLFTVVVDPETGKAKVSDPL